MISVMEIVRSIREQYVHAEISATTAYTRMMSIARNTSNDEVRDKAYEYARILSSELSLKSMTIEKKPWVYAASSDEHHRRGYVATVRGYYDCSTGSGAYVLGGFSPEACREDFPIEYRRVYEHLTQKGQLLHDFYTMRSFCTEENLLESDWHGFMMEGHRYTFYIRCSVCRGDYFYIYCYRKEESKDA